MKIKVLVQETPNPNALKFVTNLTLREGGKASFESAEEAEHVPLVWEAFQLAALTSVHLFENTMTVSQNGGENWQDLSDKIEALLLSLGPNHDPYFKDARQAGRDKLPEDLRKIDDIIDANIRPFLQGDGGDLEVIEYQDHLLKIRYEGACGSCPSSLTGTLHAIENLLKEEFDSQIEVLAI